MSDDGKELLQAGGPGGYDIYVDPAALRRLASAFDGHVARFAAAVGGFESGARLPGNALGRLPEAHHANQQYQDSHQAAVQALAEIQAVVRAVAGGLHTNADVYDGADQPPM